MPTNQHQLADWIESLVGDEKEFSSYHELAVRIGVTWHTLRRIRRGGTPNLETLRKIAEAIPQTSLADLEAMALDSLPSDEENKRKFYLEQLMSVFARLPPEDQKELLQFALIKLESKKPDVNGIVSKPEPAAPETE